MTEFLSEVDDYQIESVSAQKAYRFEEIIETFKQRRREEDSTFQRLMLWGMWILIKKASPVGGFAGEEEMLNFRAKALAHVDAQGADTPQHRVQHARMFGEYA
jgi:hypothetical protein